MSLILLFALAGLWIDGIRGLLVGAALGYVLTRVGQTSARQRLQGMQSQFLDATFAVMGALCKADGVVTRDEIRITEEIFVRMGLSPALKQAAKDSFNRGKSPDFDLDAEVDAFVQAVRGNAIFYQLFLQVQLSAVAADGQVHAAEHAMLLRVARRLGLGEADVARLEALLRAAAGEAPTAGRPPPRQRLDDAYTALGVSPESTEEEIKRAYRKLMIENHPDKLASKGLPEGMRAIAEERAREINVAYDLIKKARNFS